MSAPTPPTSPRTSSTAAAAPPHVDTYVIDVIGRLYLDNPNPTPEAVADFIDQRWGHLGEHVLDFLTTDTEQWVSAIGKTVGVRSGARS